MFDIFARVFFTPVTGATARHSQVCSSYRAVVLIGTWFSWSTQKMKHVDIDSPLWTPPPPGSVTSAEKAKVVYTRLDVLWKNNTCVMFKRRCRVITAFPSVNNCTSSGQRGKQSALWWANYATSTLSMVERGFSHLYIFISHLLANLNAIWLDQEIANTDQ